jgi:large subunit ribosomal protein L35
MPKLKTHRGTAKRIRISPRGKLLRNHASKIHFNEKKSESSKRRRAGSTTVEGAIGKSLKRALGA